jgi:hypothetical protein
VTFECRGAPRPIKRRITVCGASRVHDVVGDQYGKPARPVWNGDWFEPPHDTNHTLDEEAPGGLTLYTMGLPEYEVTEDGVIALMLLRCVGWLLRGDLSTRRGRAGPELRVPGAACQGVHGFEYALELGEPPDAELLRRSHDFRFDFVQSGPGATFAPIDVEVRRGRHRPQARRGRDWSGAACVQSHECACRASHWGR